MDGKLLVLCDEMPGTYNDGHKDYKIRDSRFLAQILRYPEDDTDRIFVSWDSIIPEDRGFIEACKYYSRFTDKPDDPLFPLSRKGNIDPATGNMKDSIQEESYYTTYQNNLNYLSSLMKKGEDWQGEAIELAMQYTLDANERFFNDFTKTLNNNGIVAIMPCFSNTQTSPNIEAYRRELLEAWKNRNEMRRKSGFRNADEYSTVNVLDVQKYSDFGEILYSKSVDEIMKIYSMPYFGETSDKKDYDEGPEM